MMFLITIMMFLVMATIFPASLTAKAVDSCPMNVLSCSPNAGGSCCSPTNGLVVLTQQWKVGFGPPTSFTMHGLWPDTCNGIEPSKVGCDKNRNYHSLESIIQGNQTLYNEMLTYWPSANYWTPHPNDDFWTHEWRVHGTCVSTLNPGCYDNYQAYQDVFDYFTKALELRETYDLYTILQNANILPDTSSHSVQEFEDAIYNALGVKPMISCSGANNNLAEIQLYFYVQNRDQYQLTDSVWESTCQGYINYPSK